MLFSVIYAIFVLEVEAWQRVPYCLGLFIVCYLPVYVWEIFSPLPLDFEDNKNKISYDFSDHVYAVEFAKMNEAELEL